MISGLRGIFVQFTVEWESEDYLNFIHLFWTKKKDPLSNCKREVEIVLNNLLYAQMILRNNHVLFVDIS